jgi:hypothetical protein
MEFSANVDIDIDEIMSELEDDDLINELCARGYKEPVKQRDYINQKNTEDDLLWALRSGRYQEFFIELERQNPEFKGLVDKFYPVR